MAYADPQSITVAAVPQTLKRTGFGPTSGTFQTSDGIYKLEASHNYGRRTRRSLRLTGTKISADPLIPAQNVRSSMSVYMVVDTPVNGYTAAEIKDVVKAFTAYLTATSGAAVDSLVGGEV